VSAWGISIVAANGVRRGLHNGFNPEMLQIAMDLREMISLELTAEANLEVGRVEQFLAYAATPTEEEVERIAEAVQLRPSFFKRDGLNYPPDFPWCRLAGGG